MIATALTFLLGVFAALLLALLLVPVLWRKAQFFARRDYEATIPATANEIRAEFDAVRAEAALTVRRQEIETRSMAEAMAKAQAALGRSHVEIAALQRRERELVNEVTRHSAERDNLRQTFSALRDKERALADSLSEAQRDGSLNAEELEALARKFQETAELAEDRKIELIAAETRIERLADALRAAERANVEKDTLIRLLRHEAGKPPEDKPRRPLKAGVMPGLGAKMPPVQPPPPRPGVAAEAATGDGAPLTAALGDLLARAQAKDAITPEEGARMREAIAEVASEVLYRTATQEGSASPLAPLLRPADDASVAAPPHRGGSLADRVRSLAAARQATDSGRRAE